jgi:hypothetical protein
LTRVVTLLPVSAALQRKNDVNKNKEVHSRLLPYANAVVQDNQTGFQSGKSTTDLLFALRQILERDFKAAYDKITRNEIYVIMAELDFPTKLIRLIKATLPTVKCCFKIQHD